MSHYNKVLKERNAYLKEGQLDSAYLEVMTNQLIDDQIDLIQLKRAFVEELDAHIQMIFPKLSLSDFPTKLTYFGPVDLNENLKENLFEKYQKSLDRDKQFKQTHVGVHRDDLKFELNHLPLSATASQGQKRMIVIALKCALLEVVESLTSIRPILLLDDVFSELDAKRREALYQFLHDRSQTLITTTDLDDIRPWLKKKSCFIKLKMAKLVKGVMIMSQKVEHSYTAQDIQVLEGLEAVRKRPGMYIGSTSQRGLHHLVWEIVDNSIDEALAGYADHITISIDNENVVTVEDNGRGMPVGIHAKTGKSSVETIFTVLHAGGKFGGGAYKVSGGLHGVGASVVNALSEFLEVYVHIDGQIYFMRFEKGGLPIEELKVIGKTDKHGSIVRFKADGTIFTETTVYDHNVLRDRIQQLAFLNKGIKIDFKDERTDQNDSFFYEGGISEYVDFLNKNKSPIHSEVVYCEGEEENIQVEVAIQYNNGYMPNVYSFCNNINTHEGGTHEEGFRAALTRVINNYAKDKNLMKKDEDNLQGEDVREGITAIISVKHPDPQYEGQTKTKLGNSEVRKIVSNVFAQQLERFLLEKSYNCEDHY